MLDTLKIMTSDIELGMYVSALDRPWLETPFLTQGFTLESQNDIDRIRKYCEYVYIDTRRSRQGYSSLHRKSRSEVENNKTNLNRQRMPIDRLFSGRKLKTYQDDTHWQEEHSKAEIALDGLLEDIGGIFDHVSDGGTLDVIQLKGSVAPIVDSMGRNPDACMWLTRLKQHDEYTYQHALSAGIWAVALGRQLGMQRMDLRSLAIGAMLMDVGKLRVPSELLNADRSLTKEEMETVRTHVDNGIELIRDTGLMNQDVYDMVAHHHERYDGSGYPRGIAGDEIPPVAQIAGIVDTYDALTSNRSYASAISPSEAIKTLYKSRDVEFRAELVEAFIQAVGIYPAGTLVELSSGEVGVVVAEYRTRRLLPKVTVVLNADKQRLVKPRVVDLLTQATANGEEPLSIRRSLEPGAFDIDLLDVDIFHRSNH